MTRSRSGLRTRREVDTGAGRRLVTPTRCAPAGRLVGRRRPEPPHGTDYAFPLDGGPPLPGPAQRVAAARRARPEPGLRPRRFNWTDDGWAGRGLARRVSTSCTSARSREGTLRRRDRAPRLSGRARRRHGRADAGRGLPRHARLGVRRCRTCSPCTSRTADRRPSSGSSTPATHSVSASASTSCTTTSARAGTIWLSSARTSPTAHPTPWGPAVNLDAPGAGEVRRWVVRQRAALVPRLPRGRAAAGRRARAPRRQPGPHLLPSSPSRCRARRAELGRPLAPDRGVGPQRPADRRPRRAEGGLGHDRAVGRRLPPRPARRCSPASAGVLRRLRPPGAWRRR